MKNFTIGMVDMTKATNLPANRLANEADKKLARAAKKAAKKASRTVATAVKAAAKRVARGLGEDQPPQGTHTHTTHARAQPRTMPHPQALHGLPMPHHHRGHGVQLNRCRPSRRPSRRRRGRRLTGRVQMLRTLPRTMMSWMHSHRGVWSPRSKHTRMPAFC